MATYGGGLNVSVAVNSAMGSSPVANYTVPANSMFIGRLRNGAGAGGATSATLQVGSQQLFSVNVNTTSEQFVAGPNEVISIAASPGGQVTGRLIGVILTNVNP